MMNNIMAALAQRICNSLTLATGMIFFALAAQSSKCQAQEDDYEFVPPQGWAGLSEIGDDDVSMMPAEGFEGLHDEPAKAVMIEAVDADGGLANVAPQLSVEEGPGGLDWDPSPTYRTRYKNGTNYVAGGGSRVQGNNWFMKIPYIIPVSANEYRLRCGANQFRVYTGSSPTWTGRYGNINSVLKLSGSDILLYDTRGKEYLFSSSASLRCTRISGLGSERIEISYSSSSITVLLKPNAGAGTEVKQIVYTIGANNLLDRIDFNEKESGVWRLVSVYRHPPARSFAGVGIRTCHEYCVRLRS